MGSRPEPTARQARLLSFMRNPPQGSIIGKNGPVPLDDPAIGRIDQFHWRAAQLIELTGLYDGLDRPRDACLDDLARLAELNRVRKWNGSGIVTWQYGSWP